MNALMKTALLVSVAGLAACASSSEKTAYVPAPQVTADAPGMEIDHAYVAYVERSARRRGIDVQWVHMPMKRVARE